MKTTIRSLKLTLTLLALMSTMHLAQAFYMAEAGRWINRDPIGEQGGYNVHAFVLNNPITIVDTDGRILWIIPIIIGGGAVGAVMTPYNANAPTGPDDPSYPPLTPEDLAAGAIGGAVGSAFGGALCKMAGRCCPRISGTSRADLHVELRNGGFAYHHTTQNGYVLYKHQNGCDVWIRPNGEVLRMGAKIPGKKFRPRTNALPGTHTTDEFVDPMCDN